jgi:hypothetical protein
MTPVILLFIGGMVEAAFTGDEALLNCLDIASTYEVPAMCVPPTADVVPYLGLQLDGSLRPMPRPVLQ